MQIKNILHFYGRYQIEAHRLHGRQGLYFGVRIYTSYINAEKKKIFPTFSP